MKNAVKVEKNEVQKFQAKVARHSGDPEKHDSKIDNALLIAYNNGDEDSGWELFKSYIDEVSMAYNRPTQAPFLNKEQKGKLVYEELSSYEKEDLLQEIAHEFFLLVNEYDFSGPFENMVRSKLRQRVFNRFFTKELEVKNSEIEFDEEELKPQGDLDLESKDTPDKHLDLYQALNSIGKRQREVVTLSIVNGWDSPEIAEELGITAATVRVTLRNGLKNLREIMIK